jgi:hypothetical protein
MGAGARCWDADPIADLQQICRPSDISGDDDLPDATKLPRRLILCLIADQHGNVANLVTGLGVAVRFGDLVEPISAPDHGAQFAGVDELLQEDQISRLRIGCNGDESRPSAEVYEPASRNIRSPRTRSTRERGRAPRCRLASVSVPPGPPPRQEVHSAS